MKISRKRAITVVVDQLLTTAKTIRQQRSAESEGGGGEPRNPNEIGKEANFSGVDIFSRVTAECISLSV